MLIENFFLLYVEASLAMVNNVSELIGLKNYPLTSPPFAPGEGRKGRGGNLTYLGGIYLFKNSKTIAALTFCRVTAQIQTLPRLI